MTRGRRETTPSEQLGELCKARDRYTALADQLRDNRDLVKKPEEKTEREQEARRIANAYEKSVANMIASCRVRHIDIGASTSGRAGIRFAMLVFFAAIGVGAVALAYPAMRQTKLPEGQPRAGGADNVAAVPAGKSQDGVAAARLRGPSREEAHIAPSSKSAPKAQHAANPHRGIRAVQPIPVAERAQHPVHPNSGAAMNASSAGKDGDGFVVKVLQEDGSLKEEYFNTPRQH